MDEKTFELDIKKLLSSKDAYTDIFLSKIVSLLKLPVSATPDEIQIAWSNQMSDAISDISSILWHKLNPYVQILISKKMRQHIMGQMVTIELFEEPIEDLVNKYKICFDTWIDSEKVLFSTVNRDLLGKLSMKDYFILQLFVLGTNTRKRGDYCLQLGIVGKSSVGKSTLFETPLSGISHFYVGDGGVGRFKTDGKTILFFHDIDIKVLVYSKDKDLIKTVTRTEVTYTKTHSSTGVIQPIHVIYTANNKLNNYNTAGSNTFKGSFGCWNMSDVPHRPRLAAHLNAVRMRFLECFCTDRPSIDKDWLPAGGVFSKEHLVLGIYDRVLEILYRIPPDSFYKEVQPYYVMAGLAKNANAYETVFQKPIKEHVVKLVEKFIPNPRQAFFILQNLN